MSPQQRREASDRIRQRLAELPEWRDAATVLLFLAMPDEVHTLPIVRDALGGGKTVAVPKVDTRRKTMDARRLGDLESDLAPGVFGILEPVASDVVEPGAIDFALVPGRAFDPQGNRLGRGGGYYDRYMARGGFRATRCAVAFACQLLDRVPHDATDLPIHLLVTEAQTLRFT
ncbi:MAG: 5-formyltetrahydrofolate cyclo-ligase [Candidatus Brocadiia bacterium]